LSRVDTALALVDSRTGQALATLAGIRTDLQPTLANSAALFKDAQDSWDDSYDDVRSLLDSTEVATTQAAQTLQVIREKTPKFTEDVTGITADFHDATHNLDVKYFHPPPRTKKQKIAAFFENFEAIFIAALRGGVL
jgi:hypothetical protein